MKAAFLFNFTKFVEWPESSFEDPQAPIVLGIIGDDPFGDDLERIIAGQKVQGRSLVIRRETLGRRSAPVPRSLRQRFRNASVARKSWPAFSPPAC